MRGPALLLALFSAACAGADSGVQAGSGPGTNVLLLVVDDLGWGDLGCYGDDFHETPAIDGLAASGMRFTDAYATSPVCSPSRASIMTGKNPWRVGITDWIPGVKYPKAPLLVPAIRRELALEEHTLAESLHAAGYATWHVGKWHLGGEGFGPLEQGFDVNVGGHSKGAPGSYFHPYAKVTPATDWTVRNLPPGGEEGDYLTERLTDEALALMRDHAAREPRRPFFLHMSYYAVHTPLEAVPELLEEYRAKQAAEPGRWGRRDARYAGMVQSVDESVARILAAVEELGLTGNTLVILTSDNGGVIGVANNGGLREGKGFLYEGGIRVPLIVRWPGVVEPGGTCPGLASGADLVPTICNAVGAPFPDDDLDGRDLGSLLRDPGRAWGRTLTWHYPHYHTPRRPPAGAVRAADWKYLRWYEDQAEELYDLGADAGEMTDLAATHERDTDRVGSVLYGTRGPLETGRVGMSTGFPGFPEPNPDHDPDAPFAGAYTDWNERAP